MVLFDVSRYETPDPKDVDLETTKYNVSIFLSAYLPARSRVGQPREPKLTASFSLIPPSTADNGFEAEQLMIQKEEAWGEFNYLNDLFEKGFNAIQHPFKPDVTVRRKKIFLDRYIKGMTIYLTAQKNHISEDLVKQESSVIIVQFASALELIAFK